MKKMTYFVMALALVLGFTQCKKEQVPANNETEGVFITLNVNGGNNGSKVIVDPTGHSNPDYATVTFENGDVIYVGNNGVYCGYLEHNGTNFTGTVNPTSTDDYLHFYFIGNKGEKSQPTSVSITDQRNEYPVISYAHSTDKYSSSTTSYTAKLQNYCSIVKFTTTNISAPINIKGTNLLNTVTVSFSANNKATGATGSPYSFGTNGDGITLHAQSNTERWAILLPESEVTDASATASGYATQSAFTISAIEANHYYAGDGINVALIPVGALSGKFTINANGDQVYFSQGNLQATTTNGGTNWSWAFAENQYDRIGNATANNVINGNGTVSSNGTIDLFGWSATTNFYGINNNTSSYSGNFVDWGANAISNGGNQANIWRTLTKDEWGYLFNNRTTAAGTAPSIGGTDNACFAKAYLFGTTHGVILFPDNYVHPTGVATPTGINQTNNTSWSTNNYSAEDWSKMEQAGAVFLPAAGGRLPSAGIVNVGAIGLYWSATFYGNDLGYCLLFNDGSLNAVYYNYNLWNGASVRLVRDAE